jgi:hypothetical protein
MCFELYIRANRLLPESFGTIDRRVLYITELWPPRQKHKTFVYSLSSSPPSKPLKTSANVMGACGCGLQDVEEREVISSFLASIVAEGPVELWCENSDEGRGTEEIVEISAGQIAELNFKFIEGRKLVVVSA